MQEYDSLMHDMHVLNLILHRLLVNWVDFSVILYVGWDFDI